MRRSYNPSVWIWIIESFLVEDKYISILSQVNKHILAALNDNLFWFRKLFKLNKRIRKYRPSKDYKESYAVFKYRQLIKQKSMYGCNVHEIRNNICDRSRRIEQRVFKWRYEVKHIVQNLKRDMKALHEMQRLNESRCDSYYKFFQNIVRNNNMLQSKHFTKYRHVNTESLCNLMAIGIMLDKE